MKVETVKVKADNDHGYMIINKDDFDSSKHELFDSESKPKKTYKRRSAK